MQPIHGFQVISHQLIDVLSPMAVRLQVGYGPPHELGIFAKHADGAVAPAAKDRSDSAGPMIVIDLHRHIPAFADRANASGFKFAELLLRQTVA